MFFLQIQAGADDPPPARLPRHLRPEILVPRRSVLRSLRYSEIFFVLHRLSENVSSSSQSHLLRDVSQRGRGIHYIGKITPRVLDPFMLTSLYASLPCSCPNAHLKFWQIFSTSCASWKVWPSTCSCEEVVFPTWAKCNKFQTSVFFFVHIKN